MPLTPSHYPAAYLLHRAGKRLFSLPALTVGAIIPDIELFVTDRLFLHSLLGAATLGTVISVILVSTIYPRLIKRLIEVEGGRVEEACRPSAKTALSSFTGCMSHVLIDALHHPYNPLLYPFTDASVDILLVSKNLFYADLAVQSFFAALLIAITLREGWGGPEGFWERLLLG